MTVSGGSMVDILYSADPEQPFGETWMGFGEHSSYFSPVLLPRGFHETGCYGSDSTIRNNSDDFDESWRDDLAKDSDSLLRTHGCKCPHIGLNTWP